MGFLRNAASTLAVSLGTIPVVFATSVILARFLSIEDRGIYGLAMALSGMLCFASQLGLESAAIYRIRRVGIEPGRVVASGLATTAAILAAVAAASLSAEDSLSHRFLDDAGLPVLWACLGIAAVQVFGLYLRCVAQALGRFDLHNAHRAIEAVGILVGVSATLVLGSGVLLHALLAVLAVHASGTAWLALVVLARTGLRRPSADEARQGLRFGVKNYALTMTRVLHERSGVLLMGYLARGAAEVALLAVALGLMRLVRLVPAAIDTALFPQIADTDDRVAAEFTARVTRHSLLWAAAVCALFLVVAPVLIPAVYGESYRESVRPFLLLLPSTAALTVSLMVSRWFMASDAQGVVLGLRGTAVAVNLALNLLLIPSWGVQGAATASLVSHTAEAIGITAVFAHRSGLSVRNILVFRASDARELAQRIRPLLQRAGGARGEGS